MQCAKCSSLGFKILAESYQLEHLHNMVSFLTFILEMPSSDTLISHTITMQLSEFFSKLKKCIQMVHRFLSKLFTMLTKEKNDGNGAVPIVLLYFLRNCGYFGPYM